MIKQLIKKSFFLGAMASLAMAIFYLGIMLLIMPSGREVWENFSQLRYFIIGIIFGFGVQIGLWVYLKNYHKIHNPSGVMPGVSGATSGTAMFACCAHHLADVLPILGLSGVALFLTQYQKPFLIIGLSINLAGIAYMLSLLNKHKENI